METNIFSLIHNYFPNIQEGHFLAFSYFLLFVIFFKLIKTFALARYLGEVKRKGLKAGGYAVSFVRSIKPWFYFSFAIWLAVQGLPLTVFWREVFNSLLVMALALQLANISRIVSHHFLKKAAGDRAVKDFSGVISFAFFFLFIIIGILCVLAIFGVNVTTLIAGLGFGGVAFALATQKIFGDLFSSITIYLDRSFAIGDFIVFNGEGGTVEKIGWRSTRLRAESGEEVVIANSLLVAGKLNNFKKQLTKRGTLTLYFSLGNSAEKLSAVHKIISDSAKASNLQIERGSFIKTSSTSLIFEIIYFGPVNQGEYFIATENFLLKIKKKCDESSLVFA
ncbi:MAG: mechanosensitive ion channel family protein [Patescibacteria group bacterium]